MMRRHLTSICAITAMACIGAAPAFAVDEAGSTSSTKDSSATSQQTMKNAGDVTCAEITQLDMLMVPGVLYYVAGHESARDESSGAMDAPKAKSEAGLTDSEAAKSDSASAGEDSKAEDADMNSASSTTDSTASEGGETAGVSSAGDQNVVPIAGFYTIPVEEVMIACSDEPDRRASDVVKEHRDSKMGASDKTNSSSNESSNEDTQTTP